jgi:hypothetical protein
MAKAPQAATARTPLLRMLPRVKPTDGVPFHSRHNKAGRFGKVAARDGFTFRTRMQK